MSTDETQESNGEPAHPYETEESFHPLGAEWEERMREELEETDFDADLGMEMARDAQRLVAGELTEAEFYAEYHDDVESEFETDARPVFDDIEEADFDGVDDGSMLKNLADIDLEGDEASRRDVMKKMGAGAAFLGYGAYASYDQTDGEEIPQDISGIRPADEGDRDARWGMVIDLERCDGCLSCVTGCIDENGTSTGANWMYVFTYENEDTDQDNFLVRPCQHCSNAPCAKVCPVRARHTRSTDGLVLTDYETCIGCRYCQVACPYGVNYFQWGEPDVPMEEITHLDKTPGEVRDLDEEERNRQLSEANDHAYDDRGKWVDSRPPQGVMGKCTMCPSRQDGHTERPRGTVACMDACDEIGMSAIHFGDMDDPESRPNEYLRRRSQEGHDQEVINFDADLTFDVNTEDDPIDVDDGFYPLRFIERRSGNGTDWRHVDSDSVVVTSGDPLPEAEEFAASTLGDVGGIPSEQTSVLYADETTTVDVRVVFDDDEFEAATERDIEVDLYLVGAGEDGPIAAETVTLEEETHLENGRLEREVTLAVEPSALDEREEDVYALYLRVEESDEEGTEWRAADYQRVFVTTDGPRTDRPAPPYTDSPLSGELGDVQPVLFTAVETAVDATVRYPSREAGEFTHEKRLVLQDGDDEDTVAFLEYTFSEQDTTVTSDFWGGKQSSFRLLEDLGTEPNITYLGDEPGPKAEQKRGPVAYDRLTSEVWQEWMEVKDNRKEHLDYGASAHDEVRG